MQNKPIKQNNYCNESEFIQAYAKYVSGLYKVIVTIFKAPKHEYGVIRYKLDKRT